MKSGFVNTDLHPPPVFVARDRGKSLSRLHKARIEDNQDWALLISKPRFLLETCAADPKEVGPMKPLQGPTPVRQ